MAFELLVVIVLLLLHGVFAAAEISILSARKTRVAELASEGSSGVRDELGFPSHAKVRAAVRTHVETIGEAFASAEPALRAAGAYPLVLADALTPQQRGRLSALSRDEAEPASLLASLARLDAKNHVEVFRRAAGSNDAVRRVGGHVGLALAGASTDADIEAASRLLDDAMSEALWFWDGGDPRRTLVSATTTLGARAVKAVFDHLAADPARDRLTATLLDAIPEAESTRAVMSDGAKADLIWLAMHESAFSGPNVRFALAARGLPCNPLHLRRSLGLEPASSLDTVRLTLDGETLSVREHWRQRCQRDTSDEALGELVRALTSAMSGEDIVAVLPELVFVEGTWGFTANRATVCLLAQRVEDARPLIEALTDRLQRRGTFEWPSRSGVQVASELPRFVDMVLAGEGRLKVGPRQWTTLPELLLRARGGR